MSSSLLLLNDTNNETIRNTVVLDLKQRAKDAKDQNDKTQALEWLKQAQKFTTTENTTNNNLVPLLQQLALYFKQRGDLTAAKKALIQSKQIVIIVQKEEEEEEANTELTNTGISTPGIIIDSTTTTASTTSNSLSTTTTTCIDNYDLPNDDTFLHDLNDNNNNITFTDEEMMDESIMVELFQSGGMPVPSQDEYSVRVFKYKQAALTYKQAGDIPKASAELRTAKQLQKVQRSLLLLNNNNNGDTKNNEFGNDGWMETLNAEDSALLGELLTTRDDDNDNTGAAGDDYLLQTTTTNNNNNVLTNNNNELSVDDLISMTDDDIKEFMAMMMTLGSSALLPTDLQRQATEQQRKAVEYKQTSLDLAKVALRESKKCAAQAERLERIVVVMKQEDSTTTDDDDFLVEDLLSESNKNDGSSSTTTTTKSKEANNTNTNTNTNPWLDNNNNKPSSQEIRQEVLRLKNQGKITEATKLLQIYKTVLAQEQTTANLAEERQIMVEQIRQQLTTCVTQQKLLTFYQHFVVDDDNNNKIDATTITELLNEWNRYHESCQRALRQVLTTTGTISIVVASSSSDDEQEFPKLQHLEDATTVCDIVERSSSSSLKEGVIEITVLEILGMEQNKNFQKFRKQHPPATATACPKLEVDVKLNLPCSSAEESSSSSCLLQLYPSRSFQRHGGGGGGDSSSSKDATKTEVDAAATFHYLFQRSSSSSTDNSSSSSSSPNNRIQIPLPNKDVSNNNTSREAKRFRQRMETNKVQFNVTVKPTNNNKGGWLFSSSSRKSAAAAAEENNKPSSLFVGRVSLEWNSLLQQNCLAGDFPLVLNSKEVGGVVRLAIRTKEPLDPEQYQGNNGATTTTTPPKLSPYTSALSFMEKNK